MKWPYCRLPLAPSNANKLASKYELWCTLAKCIRRIADFQQQQQLFPSDVTNTLPIQFLLVSAMVFKCRRYHCRLIAVNMKKNLIGRKLNTKPWNTCAFYHAPQKGPIGCKLVMSYAKLLKRPNLISSSTDMRLRTNHKIKSCGNSGLNVKREDEWEFSQCELSTDRDERCITISLISFPLRTGG